MKQTKLRTLILAAMFAALTCVATMIIHIPSPIGGYFNLGDCMVLLSAFVLGPVWGTAAGGIGSALADVICGYFIYAPGTLVIKALMALAAALIFRAFAKNGSRFGKTFSGSLLGSVAAEIIMVVGYFLYELPLFGYAPSLESAVTTKPAAGSRRPCGRYGAVHAARPHASCGPYERRTHPCLRISADRPNRPQKN